MATIQCIGEQCPIEWASLDSGALSTRRYRNAAKRSALWGHSEATAVDDARASEMPTRTRPLRQGETKAQPRARVTPVRRPTRE